MHTIIHLSQISGEQNYYHIEPKFLCEILRCVKHMSNSTDFNSALQFNEKLKISDGYPWELWFSVHFVFMRIMIFVYFV